MAMPPFPQRVVYVASHGLPYSSNGYAIRTHAVACALAELGHDVLVVIRPGRPWSIEGFDPARTIPLDQRIDGVRYIFTPLNAQPEDSQRTRLRAAENRLTEIFEVFRPGVVIGASNWENAGPAQNAARRYGCTFFYEQRGFWDMGRGANRDVGGADTATASQEAQIAATRSREYETRIARDARAVFTLNNAMKAEMITRGVPADKIHLMPNGVSSAQPTNPALTRDSLGITAKHVLGYVGSLSSYEGLETLVLVTAALRARGVDVAALVVGSDAPKGLVDTAHSGTDGADKLRAQADSLGIAKQLHVVPQQPQSRIGGYYGLLDAFVMPRRRSDMTEIVAPIKPYSAASYGMPIVMTDMPPLDEVALEVGARLFPEGDVDTLATLLENILANASPQSAMPPPVRPGLQWSHRVRPLSRLLQGETQTLLTQQFQQGNQTTVRTGSGGFDTTRLPQVMLGQHRGTLAYLAPPDALPDPHYNASRRVQLTRANILSELATCAPGVFVIDWLALRDQTAGTDVNANEWCNLWSIHDMRLNRLIMDAARIAQQRGWQCHVTGPVGRSAAPLFRTVAQVFEEITP